MYEVSPPVLSSSQVRAEPVEPHSLVQTLRVGGSGTAPGFLEAGMRVRSEECVEGSSRSPLLDQNYNDNSPHHQQTTDSLRESMLPLGLRCLGDIQMNVP